MHVAKTVKHLFAASRHRFELYEFEDPPLEHAATIRHGS